MEHQPKTVADWTYQFDKIFLINLPCNKSRKFRSLFRLRWHGIPVDVISALHLDDGARGLFETMKNLFTTCIHEGCRSILVFEDDLDFLKEPAEYMASIIQQLKSVQPGWHLLYLGANTHQPLRKVSDNLLLAEKCRATHAVAYSHAGMKACVQNMTIYKPIDLIWEDHIQPLGKSFCTYPMLVTQQNGKSNITGKDENYSFIEERFKENTKHLISDQP